MRTASMEALRDLIEQETGDREKDVDESRTIIGAEKKIRQDHHSAFGQQFKSIWKYNSRTAAQPTTKRALVPVRQQLESLEAKILQEVAMESDARKAHRGEIGMRWRLNRRPGPTCMAL